MMELAFEAINSHSTLLAAAVVSAVVFVLYRSVAQGDEPMVGALLKPCIYYSLYIQVLGVSLPPTQQSRKQGPATSPSRGELLEHKESG